ncbi:MFS transporter [Pseudonocardia xishanensis]|uniref:Major facilitator superfamily (MFS) profile domain-containing protein n=1 Tax=Pseudonocardia xishanensis TaxID=630995 RepID=A0ABP8RSR0_9PSEU
MSSGPTVALPAPRPARVASVVGFLVVMELASGITQGWISLLLPSFVERYGLTSADANWITASALLSTVVCVPLLSKLGDVYGHQRLLVVAASLVAPGSVIVALAPSFTLLLVGRVLQGAITAFLPLEFAIVRERAGENAGAAHPLVPLDMIRDGAQGLPLLAAFVFGAHLFGSSAPNAVFLGTDPGTVGFGLGLSGTALGGALVVLGAAMFLGTTLAARTTARIGAAGTLITGAVLSAASYLATAVFHHDLVAFLVWQAGLGLGGGLVAATLPTIVVARAPADSVGIASGLYNTARTAAGSVAGAVFAAVMSALVLQMGPKTVAAESAYVAVWVICACLALIVAVLAVFVTRSRESA